jgi:hypothetical protein
MNKEDVKTIVKVLAGVGIFLFLFIDSKGHFNYEQAKDVMFGFFAGWLVTYLHLKKTGKKDE